MKLQKIVNRLQKLHPKEIDLSLNRIKKLCKTLGDPQDKLKAISVVGTNGKYSTIQALFAILKETNIKCNIYTSPHIKRINERFVFNNEELSDDELADLFEEVEKIIGKNGVDVVYDGVGVKTFDGSIEVLKVRGMMVAFGNASGYVDSIDVKKHINAKGLFFTRPSIAHYTMTREELVESAKKVFDAILSKKFTVEISKKYSLNSNFCISALMLLLRFLSIMSELEVFQSKSVPTSVSIVKAFRGGLSTL